MIKDCSSQSELRFFIDYRNELNDIDAHDEVFITDHEGYEIIGQQGCGDLTMNLWNVAYINPPESSNKSDGYGRVLIHLFEEPLDKRTYSCLVKWKGVQGKYPRITIEDVRFNQYASEPNEAVFTKVKKEDGSWTSSGDAIDFAVYGKQVIRDGNIVKINRITGEFSDLRHLFLMPNLNPKIENGKKKLHRDDLGRPRFYFGKEQNDNVWFGEAQLLDNPNDQRAACCGPILLSRLYRGMGASVEQIRGAMFWEDYNEIHDNREPLKEGQYRFVPDDDSQVEVYFRRNTYRWTIIGLPKDGRKIFCFACEGEPDGKTETGFRLEDAAEELKEIGVHNALLIDEGYDVFQIALLKSGEQPKIKTCNSNDLDILVPSSGVEVDSMNPYQNVLKRNRLRATLIFAKKKDRTDETIMPFSAQPNDQGHNANTQENEALDQK